MKVVAFDGSKQPGGPVGVSMARLVERLLAEGLEAEAVRIERVRHTGCFMCGQCGHRTNLRCAAPPEDGLRRCVRKLKAADALVIGTPAYGVHCSPATQEVLVRLEHDRRERGDARLAGKPAVVLVGPRRAAAVTVVEDVRTRLEAHGMKVLDAQIVDAGEDAEAGVVEALAGTLVAALAAGSV